jgi:septum formation protein
MDLMLVLASASPRRRELLAQAGYEFRVLPANIAEERLADEDPIAFVTRLAREKAELIATRLTAEDPEPPRLVLGADTVVVVAGEVLGKPRDAADAARMLRLLSGRTHEVVTGVCLVSLYRGEYRYREQRNCLTVAETTSVTVKTISDEEIAAYIATGEPMDKAGAYAIQGYAARWIPRIEGCYFNVVGLPLARVAAMIDGQAASQKHLR